MKKYFEPVTVCVDQAICLASLFLRWPYKTAEKITLEYHSMNLPICDRELEIYLLDELLYDEDEFYLNMKMVDLSLEKFSEHLANLPNMFVLLSQVANIEKRKPRYTLYPAGKNYDASPCPPQK